MGTFYFVFVGDKEVHVQALSGQVVPVEEFVDLLEKQSILGDPSLKELAPKLSKLAPNFVEVAKRRGINTYGEFMALPREEQKALLEEAGYKPASIPGFLHNLSWRAKVHRRRLLRQRDKSSSHTLSG